MGSKKTNVSYAKGTVLNQEHAMAISAIYNSNKYLTGFLVFLHLYKNADISFKIIDNH